MKLWITGADGLLGSAMVKACDELGLSFVGSTDVDIRDERAMQAFADEHGPTHLINCAGYTAVDKAEEEQELAYAVNCDAVEKMGRLRVKVVHFSTDYVFDGMRETPYTEEDMPNPLSVYGKSKLGGEQRLLEVAPGSCVIRISWLFDNRAPCFLTKMQELVSSGKPVKVVTDQVGRPSYANDVANATLQLLDQSGIWHFANYGAVSRHAWIQSVTGQEIGKALSADFASLAKRPAYSVLSTEKIEQFGVSIRPWQKCVF